VCEEGRQKVAQASTFLFWAPMFCHAPFFGNTPSLGELQKLIFRTALLAKSAPTSLLRETNADAKTVCCTDAAGCC